MGVEGEKPAFDANIAAISAAVETMPPLGDADAPLAAASLLSHWSARDLITGRIGVLAKQLGTSF
jgi:hypothetical protein